MIDKPLNWTEFTTYAQELTTDDIWGFMFPGARWAGASTGILGMFWGQGGNFFDDAGNLVIQEDKNQQALIDVLQWYHDLVYKDKVASPESGSWDGGPPPNAFLDGKIAMYLGGSWQMSEIIKSAPDLVENVTGALLPQKEGGQPSSRCGGFGWAIGTTDPVKQEKAWQVIEYITSTEVLARHASALSVFPTRESSFDSPDYIKTAISDAAKNQLKTARPTDKSPMWSTVDELLQIAINKVALNEATPEEVVKELIDSL